ncbi:hypothetical protein HYD51_01135 [Mycoplasmopsis bovis]|nr:hypothetical protein HYD51_01135 [Mycoplasmopsis bovis]
MRKIVRVKNKLRAEKRLHKLQLEQARDKRRAERASRLNKLNSIQKLNKLKIKRRRLIFYILVSYFSFSSIKQFDSKASLLLKSCKNSL